MRNIYAGLISAVLSTTLLFAVGAYAAPSNQTINFSARLKNSSGSVVADGLYNVQFKLYSQESGGSSIWTETYHDANGPAAGQDNRVQVKNGYLNVKLGSLESFTGVDWNSSIWMTMNVGGTAQQAVIANIDWDGEMSPRIQMSAVPFAINANMLGGKSVDEFLQVGNGVLDQSSGASISINKTGTGDLMNLQSSGDSVFTLMSTGSISMGSVDDQSISVADSSSGSGKNLTLAAGSAGSGDNAGGDLVLAAGSGSGTGSDGTIVMGSSVAVGAGNTITMVGGATSLRPASPAAGTIYFDTDTQELLVYADGTWQVLNSGSGGGDGRAATKIVAASNSPQEIRDTADYVADGTADQVEINAALTAAAGGSVYLAEGTYIASGTILVPNNTILSGAGQATTIEMADTDSSFNLVELTGSNRTGQVIRDLRLDGRKDLNTAGSQTGMYISSVGGAAGQDYKGVTIDGVTVVNFRNNGLQGNHLVNSTIINNNFLNNGNDGVLVQNTSHANTWSNNTSKSNGSSGFAFFDSWYEKVSNNTAVGNNNGYYISSTNSSTFSDNLAWSNSGIGLFLVTSGGNTLTGQVFTGNNGSGLNLWGSNDNTIAENVFRDNGGSSSNSIHFTSGDRNTVSGNAIYDSSGTSYAIYIAEGSANYLSNNAFLGVGANGIEDHGTGTVYANQVDASGKLITRSSAGIDVQDSSGSDALSIDATTGNVNIAGTLDTTTATELNIGTTNATGINLGQDTTVDGDLEAASVTTSSLDTASAGTLSLGSANATSVTIGAGNTNGTILVLGKRTTASDPTGTDGAMYYNSATGTFRCYQDGKWMDCITPLPVMVALDEDAPSESWASDVGLEFELAANTKYHYRFILKHWSPDSNAISEFGTTFTNSPESNTWCVSTSERTSSGNPATGEVIPDYCGTGDAASYLNNFGGIALATSIMEGYVETGSNATTLKLRTKANTFSSNEIEEGSYGILQVVQQ